MAGRFVIGFGGSFIGITNLLIAEVAHPQHRAKLSAIVNCMYGVGSTWCSWVALANIKILNDWSWRSLTIMQCIPSVVILAAIYWVPESPRWLVAHERYEAAENRKSPIIASLLKPLPHPLMARILTLICCLNIFVVGTSKVQTPFPGYIWPRSYGSGVVVTNRCCSSTCPLPWQGRQGKSHGGLRVSRDQGDYSPRVPAQEIHKLFGFFEDPW